MKLSVAILALATVATACMAAEQASPNQQWLPTAEPAAQAAANSRPAQQANNERQGRSISSGGNSDNNLPHNGNSNTIDHSSIKSRPEQDSQEINNFLSKKNIFKTIIKLLFGNKDETTATSRQVLSILSKVLGQIKQNMSVKSRSGTARQISDSALDAAKAGVSMLQGYINTILYGGNCAERYLCEASRDATRDSRELGYVVATVGSYATSYLLDTPEKKFPVYFNASKHGRDQKSDCAKLYPDCKVSY